MNRMSWENSTCCAAAMQNSHEAGARPRDRNIDNFTIITPLKHFSYPISLIVSDTVILYLGFYTTLLRLDLHISSSFTFPILILDGKRNGEDMVSKTAWSPSLARFQLSFQNSVSCVKVHILFQMCTNIEWRAIDDGGGISLDVR